MDFCGRYCLSGCVERPGEGGAGRTKTRETRTSFPRRFGQYGYIVKTKTNGKRYSRTDRKAQFSAIAMNMFVKT